MLWKVDLYRKGESQSAKWGIIVAPNQDKAADMASLQLADADYANVEPTHIERFTGLPEGTLFIASSDA